MTDDAFAAELRKQMEDTLRPVAEEQIAKAVRPWKRLAFWLCVGYGVMAIATIAQWITG